MKKLLAILLTLAVMCSFGVSALAADTETTTFTWEAVQKDAAEVDKDGQFAQIGTFGIWIPSIYTAADLTEERIEQGYLANLVTKDLSSAVMAFTDTADGWSNLDDLAKQYNEAGMEAEVVNVNGLPALLFTNAESDTINVSFLESDDTTVTFSFYPYSDENVAALSYLMISSIQRCLFWETVKDAAAQVDKDGKLVKIADTGLAMWVPSVMVEGELTEEDVNNGSICYLAPVDDSASVNIFTWGEDMDLVGLVKYYAGNGVDDAEIVVINGIKAVMAGDEENDCIVIDYPMENGSVLEFSFCPASDEDFAQVALLMASSIQEAK
ncbi:MAG: hypothetical protein IIW12_05270 [Oscillospiraceae bacterium]|nr:hypothetical protein [Oscillospiraceae bacterium]